MPKKIPASAVPPLQLSTEDEQELRQLSGDLRHEILSQYEEFLFQSKRNVDSLRWKSMRSDGGVHAYKERKTSYAAVHDKHSYSYEGRPKRDCPQKKLAEQSHLPRVLITGTVPGSLDDVTYGMSYQDTQSLDGFWLALGNRIEESAVLATLETATMDDPYRFMGVVWFLRKFPLGIIQQRDCLTLCDTSTTTLSNGERVGVHINHSIEHRDLTELREFKTIRATTSLLTVCRQLDAQRVEVYTLQFLDTKGSVSPKHILLNSMKQILEFTTLLASVGQRKKLQWLMRRRDLKRLDAMPSDAIEPTSSGSNERCEVCDKTIGKLFSCPGTSCQLCYQRVCSRCSVSQELVVPASAIKTTMRSHEFCIECVIHANTTSTLLVAQEQAMRRFDSSSKTRERELTTLVSVDDALDYVH